MSLHEKLFKLRKNVGAVSKNSTNPFFKSKYFDINELLKHLQPHLDEHKLLLLQPIRNGEVGTVVIDVETGDSVESFMPLSGASNPQDLGKEVSYFRRYTCQSLFGLQGEDDDGQTASRTKSALTLQHPKYSDIKMWLKSGGSISDVKKKYTVSKQVEEALLS